jgi:fused signal recognition particle receptor
MKNDKMEKGFLKTKKTLMERIKGAFTGEIDEDLYEELTEILVLADVGFPIAEKIIDSSREYLSRGQLKDEEAVTNAVKQSAKDLLNSKAKVIGDEPVDTPAIILVSGVNGVGKTTSIAKLANLYKNKGKSVLLAAADTFRAAASEQLAVWAERLGVPIIKSQEGQDAAGIIFDAISSGHAKGYDVIICDTAGRLQSKKNLMNELEKMYRVCEKNKGEYNLYSLVILDAMSGQNSLVQLESFSEMKKPDGIIVTKLDGSAKGGVILAIASTSEIPIWYVGVGEGVDDIEVFDVDNYIDSIFD